MRARNTLPLCEEEFRVCRSPYKERLPIPNLSDTGFPFFTTFARPEHPAPEEGISGVPLSFLLIKRGSQFLIPQFVKHEFSVFDNFFHSADPHMVGDVMI